MYEKRHPTEKVQPVVKTQLQVLVPKNGPVDFVVEMVADQFNLLACLGADRIIGDQCFFAQWNIIIRGDHVERHR